MAKLAMQKIEILALLSDSQKIIERLQRRGVVEFFSPDEEELIRMNTASAVAIFSKEAENAREALEELNLVSSQKKSLLASFMGRKPVSTADFAARKNESEKTPQLCAEILSLKRKIAEEEQNAARLQTQLDLVQPWETLSLPQNFKGTKKTFSAIGSLPRAVEPEALEALLEEKGVCAHIDPVGQTRGQSFFVATVLKQDEKNLLAALRSEDFSPAPQQSARSFPEEARFLREELAKAEDAAEKARERLRSFGGRQPEIEFYLDLLQMKIDKYEAIAACGMTERVLVIRGYIPEKYVRGLVAEFEAKYTVAITVSDPGPEEEAPVLLENGAFSAPVEAITEMYAMPNRRDLDPTPWMAFFYYLFFGMMLSDAGYGLVMILVTVLALWKFPLEEKMRKTLQMFRNCGVSTLFWGILFGSWFGDLPQIIAKSFFGSDGEFSTALWFEPIDDPIKLLLFSFGLGILHLFLGLAAHFYQLWREGKRWDAVCDVIPVYITILGVAPVGAGLLTTVPPLLTKIGMIAMVFGVVLFVLTGGRSRKSPVMRLLGGVYALYNMATGYLGDILSYSRLLALGLATGSIAGVFNLIVTMPENPVLKLVMMCTVGVVAHIANLAINLLGAYVHTDRLQFVELFSKFYEGGGRAFAPLKANTQHFRFEKENIYHD